MGLKLMLLLISTCVSANRNESTCADFGYELIQAKLEYLEFRFTELFVQLKEQDELFANNQRRIESEQNKMNRMVDRHERKIVNLIEGMNHAFGTNVSVITDQSRQILELQTICSNHDLIQKALNDLRPRNGLPFCTEGPAHASVLCRMMIADQPTTVQMERHRFGGDWLMVLQRLDGTETFNRNWTDYRNGFGTPGREFWLGLERLHQLTKNSPYEVLMEMEDFAGNYGYARYSKFSVGSELEQYSVKELGTHSGTASNSFATHKGRTFSTAETGTSKDCAKTYTGGWWYYPGVCYDTHFSGIWSKNNDWTSIVWKKFGSPDNLGLKFARMMIRKI
ncbi:angiopoietin-4-like [Armigeres subalbatus]|uniref:angiopoietin-4-like n=1 Tax=Armigeres subalbatus TaxID=124917 RepID=UPI002ED1D2F0